MKIVGSLYAFLFISTHREFLGIKWSWFIKAIGPVLILWLLFSQWPLPIIIAVFILTVAVRLLYWQARRDGFVRFRVTDEQLPPPTTSLKAGAKLSIRATGIFALADRDSYVLSLPAEYWYTALGTHIIMVQVRRQPASYLYQFIELGQLLKVVPGEVIFDKEPQKGLFIQFKSTWGPAFVDAQNMYYVDNSTDPPGIQLKMYMTFTDEASRFLAWESLLKNVNQA